MNKAVFLDRDGIINIDKNYVYKIEDFEFVPGIIHLLKIFKEMGYLLIIVTNQSGIARGYFTEEEFNILNNWMINKLLEYGVEITATYYCPHHPNAFIKEYRKKCECRKPGIALFIQAANDYNIDFDNSIAIGDKLRDCEICNVTNCKGFLVTDEEICCSSNIIRVSSILEICNYFKKIT